MLNKSEIKWSNVDKIAEKLRGITTPVDLWVSDENTTWPLVNIYETKGEFEKVQAETAALFNRKMADYGPENISALGENGVFVRMWDKINRLKTLTWDKKKEPSVTDEAVEDTLKDISNYALIWILVKRGKWGK